MQVYMFVLLGLVGRQGDSGVYTVVNVEETAHMRTCCSELVV